MKFSGGGGVYIFLENTRNLFVVLESKGLYYRYRYHHFFTQVLSLNQEDLLNITNGSIINLVAGDLQRFEHSAIRIVILAQAVLEVCGISCLKVYLFGWKPLSGIGFMVSLVLYYGMAGQISLKLRTKISHVADQRVDMMNSIISGIRSVKMYAWEGSFMEKVKRMRR